MNRNADKSQRQQLIKGPYPHADFHRVCRNPVVESANSTAESGDNSTTDTVIVSRLSLSNMVNILKPQESANSYRPTFRVG